MKKTLSVLFSLIMVFSVISSLDTSFTEISASSVVKVACVGDSITYGFGHNDARSYPSVLGELLGEEYEVKNFGQGGQTLMKKADAPYWNSGVYKSSKEYNPDIVIIMLGTNDGKHFNWVTDIKETFEDDMKDIIDVYRNLPSKPDVYFMSSPTSFDDGGAYIVPANVEEIASLQRKVAVEVSCPLIDMNAFTKDKGKNFPDNIHPDAEGYAYMADIISDVILRGTTHPAPPVNLTCKSGNNRLILLWDDSFHGGSYIESYNIYLNGEFHSTVLGRTLSLKNLINGQEYSVQVTAVNSSGESERSEILLGTPTASTPKIKGVEDGARYDLADGNIIISWSTSATATLNGAEFLNESEITEEGEYTLVVTNDNVVITINFTVVDSSAIPGDIDKDGEITVADALAVLRVAAQMDVAEESEISVMDMDKDGEITVSDALAVLRIAANLV